MKQKVDLLILGLAMIAAAVALKFCFVGDRAFQDAALGELTVRYQARSRLDTPIHTVEQPPDEIAKMMEVANSGAPNILILGNSQTHSINLKQVGEVNYPELLSRRRLKQNILTNSLPNGSLQEMLVIASWWMERIKVTQVVIPVFMDDLREDGLRGDFLRAVLQDGFRLSGTSPLETKLNRELAALKMPGEQGTREGEIQSKFTPQELVEAYLNKQLDRYSSIWRSRPNARGDVFIFLYNLRNTVFGITPSTKRKMIPARYRTNLEALRLLLDACRQRGVRVLAYIPPIRSDVPVPYDLEEYLKFKNEVQQIAVSYGASFANLENLVPGPLWGFKQRTRFGAEAELDYMHFQALGHRQLANALDSLIISPK